MLQIRVPQLGEGLREVRVVELHRRVGDSIRRGDTLYVIETDKSTVEMEAPEDGKIAEWKVAAGDIVPVNAVIVVLDQELAEKNFRPHQHPVPRVMSPRAQAYAKGKDTDDTAPEIAPPTHTPYRDRKVAGAHRALVYRFRRSASITIQGTLAIDIPWSALLLAEREENGLKATPFQVFGYTVAQLAKIFPKFRSVMVGDDTIREYDHVNVGLAVARPDDELITAVVRGADQLTLAEFTKSCTQQMRAAIRSGDQAAEDTQILLTHLGDYGIPDAIPTLVAPASSIFFLGVPKKETSTARVALTFDHRLINGAAAAHFLDALLTRLRDEHDAGNK
ncbi:MAG TPA: 2-oxo acid dehydrogenase subunit E2 [Casimicrobiaceae bacterium]|nr:2-oxo acid dehydrogenase subunit E2 [Casimicrobiaceae bacterium]